MSDSTKSTTAEVVPAQPTAAFSSISELFSKSWDVVKKTWKKLLLISIVFYAIVILLSLFFGAVGAFSMGVGMATGASSAAVMVGVVIFLGLIVGIAFGTAYSAGSIMIISEPDSEIGAWKRFTNGFSLVVPLTLLSLVIMFLVVGGLFVFFIPGIIMSILLSFAVYDMILHKTSVTQSMKNSVAIITRNFGEIFIRWLVVVALGFGIGLVLGFVQIIPILGLIISIVGQVLFGWIVMAYWLMTFTEARARTNIDKPGSTTWMWIVGVIGWVLIALSFYAMGAVFSGVIEELGKQVDESMVAPQSSDYKYDSQFENTDGPEYQLQFEEMLQEDESMTEEEKQAVRELQKMFDSGEIPYAEDGSN